MTAIGTLTLIALTALGLAMWGNLRKTNQERDIDRLEKMIKNRNEVIDWQRRKIDEYAAKDAARHAMLSAAGKKGAAAREANRA